MNRNDILNAVSDACVEILRVERGDLTEATLFAEDLDADSLALVEIVMELEEKFDLEIPEDELEGVTTIGAAVDLVAGRLSVA